jgi:glycine/D-amino acid oxidase-like deaminating enzyme
LIMLRRSYWQEVDSSTLALPKVEPPRQADIVVVGGGLAGTSTAIAILQRQPGVRVVLLEARFIGFGASGRNGGLMSPLPAPVWLLTADRNPDHAWALRALNSKVLALGKWLAANMPGTEVVPCMLRLQAMGRFSQSGLARVAATLERAGIAFGLAPDTHRRGLLTLEMPTFCVHPYGLVRALATYAERLGAQICEDTHVAGIVPTDGGVVVQLTGCAPLRTRKLVMCTNAYTGAIGAPSAPRAKVVHNYMLATEPLEEDALRQLGSGRTFVVELNRSYVFYRVHRTRLLYGGVETFLRTPETEFAVPTFVRKVLEDQLAKSIPWRPGLRIASTWSGAFHATATDLPIVVRAASAGAIVFNVGYGGTGLAMTQLLAPHAAALALDMPLAEADDARLGAIVRNTGIPIKGLLQLGAGVAWDLTGGRLRLKSP